MNYSQFIHGKRAGARNYEVVAMTANLAERRTELENIAQQYRFWGAQPPVSSPIAVGVFKYQDQILLVQAMQAMRRNGQPALDVKGRPYTQHRYVFIPPQALHPLQGRVWLLLNWVMEQTRGIPVFDQLDRNLSPLSADFQTQCAYNPTEGLDKLTRSLTLKSKNGDLVLLNALSALVNGKRVLFDASANGNVFSEDLLESLLLLLPAFIRLDVSVAAGALDEKVCTEATLMVKTNGAPNGSLSDDLVWNKRANNQFFGAVQNGTLTSHYAGMLDPLVVDPASRPVLLRLLDTLTQPQMDAVSGWQRLENGWMATQLIPAMPDPKVRARYWQRTLQSLSPEGWRTTIPTILDDIGLETAWAELQQLTNTNPGVYAPLSLTLWRNFSEAYVQYVLTDELPGHPRLAENLIRHGLLTELPANHRAAIFELCLSTVAQLTATNTRQGASLLDFVSNSGVFETPEEQLALSEVALGPNPSRETLLLFFSEQLASRLPTLAVTDLKRARVFQGLQQQAPEIAQLIEQATLEQGRNPTTITALANAAVMSLAQRQGFYAAGLNAWQLTYRQADPLLTDLLTQWIATYPPAERPAVGVLFQPLHPWLQRRAPEAIRALLTDPECDCSLPQWETLAADRFPDRLGQVIFLDHVTAGEPVQPLLRHWLLLLAKDRTADERFAHSYTWHQLERSGPAWLSEATAQLLGRQSVTLSALLPVLERLQATLDLPQATLFAFLERLPNQGDEDMGMMLAAYLPQIINTPDMSVEALPLWQVLNAQAPKVAQIYKILADGHRNPAVDLFNQFKLSAALSEAPEYAAPIARWLQVVGKGNWVSGKLLETLVHQWQTATGTIDAALLAGLLQPDLTGKYTFDDWLNLAQICWQPDLQSLWPLSGQPALNSGRQQAQVLSVAQIMPAHYQNTAQIETLLSACQNWGVNQRNLAELISKLPAQLCNFRMIHPYLYANGAVIAPDNHTHQNLLALTMQLNLSATDATQFQPVLMSILKQQLQAGEATTFITTWFNQSAHANLYRQTLHEAVLDLAATQFSAMTQRAHQFKRQGVLVLSQTVVAALDQFWADQRQTLL